MKVVFKYNPKKEFDNFRNTSTSINHPEPTEIFKAYLKKYKKLEPQLVVLFAEEYLNGKQINIQKIKEEIETNWQKISQQFFTKADKIFKNSLPVNKITAYLTIDSRCSYNFEKGYFFIHLYPNLTNKTIMHELWHWYFWYNGGRGIKEKFGQKIFNDIKESLTVLLNIEFADLLGETRDKGYPQHQSLREKIIEHYNQTKNVYAVINHCVKQLG